MPNWCWNSLSVRGEKKAVEEFKKKAKLNSKDFKTALSLAKLYPEPDYKKIKVDPAFPKREKEKSIMPDWWNWRVTNWGTKWDVEAYVQEEREFKNGKKQVRFNFNSAWSPPCEWLRRVAEDYPHLVFRLSYEETGMNFKGTTIGKGKEFIDRCYPIYPEE